MQYRGESVYVKADVSRECIFFETNEFSSIQISYESRRTFYEYPKYD